MPNLFLFASKADKYEEISTILPDTVVYWIKGGLIFATFKGVNRVETSRTTTLKPAETRPAIKSSNSTPGSILTFRTPFFALVIL